jgi:hypothetical protein
MARHIAQLERDFISASSTIRGAGKRIQSALDAYEALQLFIKKVNLHLRDGTFALLPQVIETGTNVPLRGVHKLATPPWEGSFLVSEDGKQVIGLVFSREPHDYLDKIGDLFVKHALTGK